MENTAMAAAMAGCGVVLAVLLYGLTGMLFRSPVVGSVASDQSPVNSEQAAVPLRVTDR